MIAVDGLEQPAESGAQHPVERGFEQLDDGDLESQLAQRRRHLRTRRSPCQSRRPAAHPPRPHGSRRRRRPFAAGRRPEGARRARRGSGCALPSRSGARSKAIRCPSDRVTVRVRGSSERARDAQAGLDLVGLPPLLRSHLQLVAWDRRRGGTPSRGPAARRAGSARHRCSTRRPSNPSSRSVAAAVPPASDAPTTTKVRAPGTTPRSGSARRPREPHRSRSAWPRGLPAPHRCRPRTCSRDTHT